MRILKSEDKTPIYVAPGDTITAQIKQDGEVVASTSEVITEPLVVDRITIVEAEEAELDQLGMTGAIGGFFGKSR